MTVFGYVNDKTQPSLPMLGKLAQLAEAIGRDDLADRFLEPFLPILGTSATRVAEIAAERRAA